MMGLKSELDSDEQEQDEKEARPPILQVSSSEVWFWDPFCLQ
jgi:hypothetical protein